MQQDPNSKQIGGGHYKATYQHWDMVADSKLNYFEATATKYLTRWREKGGRQDLEKSLHYFDKLMHIYQAHRLPLPVTQRPIEPVSRFLREHPRTTALEKKIFYWVVSYTTLEELIQIREAICSMIDSLPSTCSCIAPYPKQLPDVVICQVCRLPILGAIPQTGT